MSLHIDSVIRGKSVACSLCVCDFDFSLSHSNALSLFGEKYNGEEPLLSKTTISFSLSKKKKIFFPLSSVDFNSRTNRVNLLLLLLLGTINRRTNYIPLPPPLLCLSEMQFLNQDACYSRLKQVTRLYLLGCIAMGEERGERGKEEEEEGTVCAYARS